MKYEVGQPVWVKVEVSKFRTDPYPEDEWVKAKVVSVNGSDVLVETQRRYRIDPEIKHIFPRPTIMWKVRQWVRSLVGKK